MITGVSAVLDESFWRVPRNCVHFFPLDWEKRPGWYRCVNCGWLCRVKS